VGPRLGPGGIRAPSGRPTPEIKHTAPATVRFDGHSGGQKGRVLISGHVRTRLDVAGRSGASGGGRDRVAGERWRGGTGWRRAWHSAGATKRGKRWGTAAGANCGLGPRTSGTSAVERQSPHPRPCAWAVTGLPRCPADLVLTSNKRRCAHGPDRGRRAQMTGVLRVQSFGPPRAAHLPGARRQDPASERHRARPLSLAPGPPRARHEPVPRPITGTTRGPVAGFTAGSSSGTTGPPAPASRWTSPPRRPAAGTRRSRVVHVWQRGPADGSAECHRAPSPTTCAERRRGAGGGTAELQLDGVRLDCSPWKETRPGAGGGRQRSRPARCRFAWSGRVGEHTAGFCEPALVLHAALSGAGRAALAAALLSAGHPVPRAGHPRAAGDWSRAPGGTESAGPGARPNRRTQAALTRAVGRPPR